MKCEQHLITVQTPSRHSTMFSYDRRR